MIELFFDLTSPWTWLAVHNLVPMAKRHGAEIVWRPILVGGVFNAVNQAIYETRANPVPAKARYMDKDLQDWARLAGLEIHFPPACGHPVNAVLAMRVALAMQARGKLEPFAFAAFDALWAHERDLADPAVLAPLIAAQGEEPEAVFAEARSDPIKAQLRTNTDELIARGGFGSPSMFVNGDDMYFGNDRLPLVEAALIRKRSPQAA
ncbi:2-hydroxychromene-2-carboxylate isomerase [Novosphingobium sp. Gsoil 351]|uniref:2-hydroxychromene-2-carboxylate isomerase n=1 Tax=Novosphingobium sp. Gsoil 351 TaxID=2675225 RepID=UPI0012B5019E|nr:2-hydroxychromene-2-carboxylate isomerase [Novosphingobium sp. Gsoil 351]QGN54717.1 2-hydroxychromene-2-carboxylate isomerase [Novosphingobium sp. Gsoil 351]